MIAMLMCYLDDLILIRRTLHWHLTNLPKMSAFQRSPPETQSGEMSTVSEGGMLSRHIFLPECITTDPE
jgi:hypothetical protein